MLGGVESTCPEARIFDQVHDHLCRAEWTQVPQLVSIVTCRSLSPPEREPPSAMFFVSIGILIVAAVFGAAQSPASTWTGEEAVAAGLLNVIPGPAEVGILSQ